MLMLATILQLNLLFGALFELYGYQINLSFLKKREEGLKLRKLNRFSLTAGKFPNQKFQTKADKAFLGTATTSSGGSPLGEMRTAEKIPQLSNAEEILRFSRLRNNQLIEYLSPKGTKNLALIYNKKKNNQIVEIINNVNHATPFMIQTSKIMTIIEGQYNHSQLRHMEQLLSSFNLSQVETVWKITRKKEKDETQSDKKMMIRQSQLCEWFLDGQVDPQSRWLVDQIMMKFGSIYFQENQAASSKNNWFKIYSPGVSAEGSEKSYSPKTEEQVMDSLEQYILLTEFKYQFQRMNTILKNPSSFRNLQDLQKQSTSGNESENEEAEIDEVAMGIEPENNSKMELIGEENLPGKEDEVPLILMDETSAHLTEPEKTETEKIWNFQTPSSYHELRRSLYLSNLPSRMSEIISLYISGLKELLFRFHPWTIQGLTPYSLFANANNHHHFHPLDHLLFSSSSSRMNLDRLFSSTSSLSLNTTENLYFLHQREENISKAISFLQFLELSVSYKNILRLLELLGIYSAEETATNIDREVMNVQIEFPEIVLEEANYLLQQHETIRDPDERLRLDLRYLENYSIDPENSQEIDDAISIEYLPNGQEKVWVHVADVSRWIRPGSQLSLEAEKRMSAIYLPDEKIPMFPERLLKLLLSLDSPLLSSAASSSNGGGSGSGKCIYAVSCGAILDKEGDILSYEVCPSKIRGVRRLTYPQLDHILTKHTNDPEFQSLYEDDPFVLRKVNGSITSQAESSNRLSVSAVAAVSPSSEIPDKFEVLKSLFSPQPVPFDESFPDDGNLSEANLEISEDDDENIAREAFLRENATDIVVGRDEERATSSISPAPSTKRYPRRMVRDLIRLNYWAGKHNRFRREVQGGIDEYLRDHTELSINVRKVPSSFPGLQGAMMNTNKSFPVPVLFSPFRDTVESKTKAENLARKEEDFNYFISGQLIWCNASSHMTVSEYMLLMSDLIGRLSMERNISVYYKLQSSVPPVTKEELQLQSQLNETSFFRTYRLLKRLKGAIDSKEPGIHQTSGSRHYVQCTSPIRRYHDLYNHYRLKAAMHQASTQELWYEQIQEETGIHLLENMATNQERIERLQRIKLLSRQRDQYWLLIYLLRVLFISSPSSLHPPSMISSISSSVAEPVAQGNNEKEEAAATARTPPPNFDCVIVEEISSKQAFQILLPLWKEMGLAIYQLNDSFSTREVVMYDAFVLAFGSSHRFKLLAPSRKKGKKTYNKGEIVSANFYFYQTPSVQRRIEQLLSSSASAAASTTVNYQLSAQWIIGGASLLLPRIIDENQGKDRQTIFNDLPLDWKKLFLSG